MNVTAVFWLSNFFINRFVLAAWLIGIAIAATSSLVWPDRRRGLLELLPQQFTLMMSAGGAIVCIWAGHFADGVIRPSAFLLVDQIPAVLIALMHSGAIVEIYISRKSQWKIWGYH